MNIANNFTKLERVPVATWTIKDILIVTSCVFSIGLIFYILTLIVFGDDKTAFQFAWYVALLLTLFLPLFWLKRKYGLSKEVLGLRKGHLKLSSLIIIGILPALIYSFLLRMTPLWHYSALANMKVSDYYIYIILAPLSINGFALLVLTPISEEILDRGFIYGYLRRRFGITSGLILQALFFSLSHPSYLFGNTIPLIIIGVVVGLIFGILYEITGSLYPSIICHSVINYLFILLSIAWK